jgi:DNA-binding winged helix-turn-helix (wHTH) protein
LLLAERTELLRGLLAELLAEYREVLVLRELEQLSYREIASIAGFRWVLSGHASAGRANSFSKTFWITRNEGAIDVVTSTKVVSLPQRYRDVHLEVDFASASMSVDSRPMALTRKEYELLTLLVQNAGEIISRNILLVRVWGYSPQARTRTLDVHIVRLRKKLGAYSGRYIETIKGMGYRFQPFRERPPLPDHCGVPAIVQPAGACEAPRELSI